MLPIAGAGVFAVFDGGKGKGNGVLAVYDGGKGKGKGGKGGKDGKGKGRKKGMVRASVLAASIYATGLSYENRRLAPL